jgi:hypothetical protein
MKKYLTFTVIALLIILGALYYSHNASQNPVPTGETATTTEATTTGATATTTTVTKVPVIATSATIIAITQSDSGKIIHVKKGTRIAIALGTDMWTLNLSPMGIINRITYIATMIGVQGIYTADKIGTTVLSGEGRPVCKQGEACPQYIINFKVTIVVEK